MQILSYKRAKLVLEGFDVKMPPKKKETVISFCINHGFL